jgi:hypothetical protein
MKSGINCREIADADLTAVTDLLTQGFERTRAFWEQAMARLHARTPPASLPKYGYLLDDNGTAVGVLLLICTTIEHDGKPQIRCNSSSWYVEPKYRWYSLQLAIRAKRRTDVTYTNLTPNLNTLPLVEVQGFTRYCNGRLVAAPALADNRDAEVYWFSEGDDWQLSRFEANLLIDHADYGCISLVCATADATYPFVFLPQRKGLVPSAYLVYCRDLGEFVHYAAPIGRFLAAHGLPLVGLDANGPIAGLTGRYSDGEPKYYKGPDQPRLGDLAYSERAMFGF